MKCKLSEKCEFGNLCKYATRHDSVNVLGCSSFKTKKPMTNEEWFESLTTEKKAKIIKMVINTCISCKEHKTVMTRGCLLRQNMAKNLLFLPCMDEDGICEWLKQPHTAK